MLERKERRNMIKALRYLVAGIFIYATVFSAGLSGLAFSSIIRGDGNGEVVVAGIILVVAALVCFWGTEKFWIYSKRWM